MGRKLQISFLESIKTLYPIEDAKLIDKIITVLRSSPSWKRTERRRPIKSGNYLIILNKCYQIAYYNSYNDVWSVSHIGAVNPVYWSPLPQMPKNEESSITKDSNRVL